MEEFMNGLGELVNASELTLAEVVYALEAFKLDLLTSDDDEADPDDACFMPVKVVGSGDEG